MKLKPITRGVMSFIPGLLPYLKKKMGKGTYGGTDSARYCYSIWMRHLIYSNRNFGRKLIKNVAEIGPGDSLGMGLMALITGAEKYYVFEVKKQINQNKNIEIFNELVKLFINKEDIPGDDEFPLVEPKLSDYKFPEYLFEGIYDKLTDVNRLKKIRESIENESCDEIEIKYIIPWNEKFDILNNKIDFLFTQVVMEHIIELENAYNIMYKVLVPGGMISHEIDFSSHETHEKWNGHLNYVNILWKIIMHGRPYDINRQPHSKHIEYIQKCGFTGIKELFTYRDPGSSKIKNKKIEMIFSEKDREIKNAFIQAQKPE